MREILFRWKRLNVGGWVYGDLSYHVHDGDVYISPANGYDDPDCYKGDPATVGQYTGLTDKNGVKIFEGDIVKFKHGGEFAEGGIYFRNYAVEYVNTFVTYGLRLRNRSIHFPLKQATIITYDVVVIGNIHDNPELLKDGGGVNPVVVDISLTRGGVQKYSKVVCAGVLEKRPGELYIQSKARGKTEEIFIPLSSMHDYIVRDPY